MSAVHTGIPEINLPAAEPFRLNELSLSLTTGPNGYRVHLRDIDLYGASNFSVSRLRYVRAAYVLVRPGPTRPFVPLWRCHSNQDGRKKKNQLSQVVELGTLGAGDTHATATPRPRRLSG